VRRPNQQKRDNTLKTTMIFVLPIILVLCQLLPSRGQGSEAELEQVMLKVEQDVRDFAKEIERVFAEDVRCSSSTLKECRESNYHECDSTFPNTECISAPELGREECISSSSQGLQCTGRYDFHTTSIRLAPFIAKFSDGNPSDPEAKEDICYSKQAEAYMVEKYEAEKTYWAAYGVTPPPSYFGSVNGLFRIHPAKPTVDDLCNTFDNTKRPWFVAATSGPKDVVMILDISGSMNQRGRLPLMIEAAHRVLDTLTVGDHVGVVVFSDDALTLMDDMLQATEANIESLKSQISAITADGGTNFLAGFNVAFDLLARSTKKEDTSGCASALLFLTDGEMNTPAGVTAIQVINSINQREIELNISPLIFMYGLGEIAAGNDATEDLKTIACATGGMWSHVEDGGDLASSMSNYYKRFALGLGEGSNEGFAAWVDPYLYSDGYTLGTTVSAPVFDRSVEPPVLVGAVGLDIPMSVMDKALGVDAGSRETLNKLVLRSTAFCPTSNLTNCVLQSLRLEAGTDEALCEGECDAFVGIRPQTCPNQSDLPTYFWANLDNRYRTFIDRACCAVGEVRENLVFISKEPETNQCVSIAKSSGLMTENDDSGLSIGAKVGIAIGSIVGFVVICMVIWWFVASRRKPNVKPGESNSGNTSNTGTEIKSMPAVEEGEGSDVVPSEQSPSIINQENGQGLHTPSQTTYVENPRFSNVDTRESFNSITGETLEILPPPTAPMMTEAVATAQSNNEVTVSQ